MTSLDPAVQRSIAARDPRVCQSPQPLAELVDTATSYGKHTAQELTRVHGSMLPSSLADAVGLTVHRDSWEGLKRQTVFGECAPDSGVITVYHRQIKRATEALTVSVDTAEELVIGHELGHCVMPRDEAALTCQNRSRLRKVFPWRSTIRTQPSSGLREAAAHAFTAELVESPFDHPEQLLHHNGGSE